MASYSSSVGRAIFHLCFKIKYSHRIFRHEVVEQRCRQIFTEIAISHKIEIYEIGFDMDHVHLTADIGLHSIPEIAKLFKGISAKLLLREFPFLKHHYFYGSGLWSPAVFFDSIGRNIEEVNTYVKNQGFHVH